MKASELRIGNKAFYKEKVVEIASISGIKYSFGNQDITICLPDNSLLSVDILQLSPIPLTPELLEKGCGFDEDMVLALDEGEIRCYGDEEFHIGGNDSCTRGMVFMTKRKSLHQLQNLYFTLTGEELEIDLKTLQQ